MKTLIELMDERPLENVLAPEVFRPERIVYICAQKPSECKIIEKNLLTYFKHRGIQAEIVFLPSNPFQTDDLLSRMKQAIQTYPDCALDITGGTDAALFAAGLLCAEYDIPVFTYSRRRNSFFPIRGELPFEDGKCTVKYNVEDFILMAGGAVREGRVDNDILGKYLRDIEPFFNVYLKHRREWNRTVSYIQRLSQQPKDVPISLHAEGAWRVKTDRGGWVDAPVAVLTELQGIGFLKELKTEPQKHVSFAFRDEQIRKWLRDVGSVLEIYVYKKCRDTGLFRDVHSSVIVDWENEYRENAVSNEIDVMASCGIAPLFISCKTCEVKTEALNELAILRDRFGSGVAKAAIVTSERGGAAMRNRAQELDIMVIDLADLQQKKICRRLHALCDTQK